VGVLTSAESTQAAKRLVAAMERFGAIADRPATDEGLLTALLFDPKYKSVLDGPPARGRTTSATSPDRLAGGRGTLGGLLKDEPAEASVRQASNDLQVTLATCARSPRRSTKAEGTLGALIVDPTLYERLSNILDGASRQLLLRSFIRGLGNKRTEGWKATGR
jgi:phospholipid/cholesterol/gamma-HCH transport system substrate-binding protein